jgi:hypothetical protein
VCDQNPIYMCRQGNLLQHICLYLVCDLCGMVAGTGLRTWSLLSDTLLDPARFLVGFMCVLCTYVTGGVNVQGPAG